MKFENVIDTDYREGGETSDGKSTLVEFLNANQQVNPGTWEEALVMHEDMAAIFHEVVGITIARYDYREVPEDQKDYGLTFIICPRLEGNVQKAAELIGLPIFMVDEVGPEKMRDLLRGVEEYQTSVSFWNG